MQGETHSIGGEEIIVVDSAGALPAILFVHGTMMDGAVWHRQVSALASRFRCVRPDLRGHGRSTAASPDISFEDHCNDLAASHSFLASDAKQAVWPRPIPVLG